MLRSIAVVTALLLLTVGCAGSDAAPDAARQQEPLSADDHEIRAAIESYYNAFLNADVDALVDALHPEGPMYPAPTMIDELRATADETTLDGTATIKDYRVIASRENEATVWVAMSISADLAGDGRLSRDEQTALCDMRKLEGHWKLAATRTDPARFR